MTANLNQPKIMIEQLNEESTKVDFKMNSLETRVMQNIDENRNIKTDDTVITAHTHMSGVIHLPYMCGTCCGK